MKKKKKAQKCVHRNMDYTDFQQRCKDNAVEKE